MYLTILLSLYILYGLFYIVFEKIKNKKLLLSLKDYWDSIHYRDIYRETIVIVKFLLSLSASNWKDASHATISLLYTVPLNYNFIFTHVSMCGDTRNL